MPLPSFTSFTGPGVFFFFLSLCLFLQISSDLIQWRERLLNQGQLQPLASVDTATNREKKKKNLASPSPSPTSPLVPDPSPSSSSSLRHQGKASSSPVTISSSSSSSSSSQHKEEEGEQQEEQISSSYAASRRQPKKGCLLSSCPPSVRKKSQKPSASLAANPLLLLPSSAHAHCSRLDRSRSQRAERRSILRAAEVAVLKKIHGYETRQTCRHQLRLLPSPLYDRPGLRDGSQKSNCGWPPQIRAADFSRDFTNTRLSARGFSLSPIT